MSLLFTQQNIATNLTAFITTPRFLWLGFAAVLLLAVIMSIILEYHWSRYGYSPVAIGIVRSVYWSGTAVILILMFGALTFYTQTL